MEQKSKNTFEKEIKKQQKRLEEVYSRVKFTNSVSNVPKGYGNLI